ncbi:hypothetical protein JCM18694_34290 [Prolixibacter denitrificans]|uniref:Uncharacterized protein n=1 Tax=Prolixibacter denitrificans TaxID=1541063 RepID=A0ABQ0ZP66_9BACT|nr:hypothetical protein JCM18694_34290 [Prolixibacter denitrificans]
MWSAGTEEIQFQTAQSQLVYSDFHFYSQIVKDELAVFQQRAALELPMNLYYVYLLLGDVF